MAAPIEEFPSKKHDALCKAFFIISLVLFIAFLAFFIPILISNLSKYTIVPCQYQDLFFNMSGILASFFSATLIAYVIRKYDLIQTTKQENRALSILQPYIYAIVSEIEMFYPQFRSFEIIKDDGTIVLPTDTIYYSYQPDSVSESIIYDFIDINKMCKESVKRLDATIDKCLNARMISQCNVEIIDLLTTLKLNNFIKHLNNISKCPMFISSPNETLKKEYDEFNILYEKLVQLLPNHIRKINFQILSDEEKSQYIQEINDCKNKLVQANMPLDYMIFKGSKRIN